MFKFSVLSTLILTFCLGVSAQYKEEDLSLSIREINEKYYQGTNFYVGVAPGSSYLSPANKYAPDVKKVLNNQRDPSDLVWDKLKYTIKYLRSVAERVDGIGWQAHVSLGWENDPEKVEGLKRQIEWAHANHLEFHITELDVICPVDKWKTDRQAQAKTIDTICDIAMSYVGKGMATINFWDIIDGSRNLSGNNKYFGGIFPDHDIEKHRSDPVYLTIKKAKLKHAPSLSTQNAKR